MSTHAVLVTLVTLVTLVLARGAAAAQHCEHDTCGACITDPAQCLWCSVEGMDTDQRCKVPFEKASEERAWCAASHVQRPRGSAGQAGPGSEFSSEPGRVVQIKPQQFNMRLRVNEPQTISFSYKLSENSPVDVYFLLDVSKTMMHIHRNLIEQTTNIYETLTSLTKDVHMGLGTFIDKNIQPFASFPNQSVLESGGTSYSFKHELNLTDRLNSFKEKLENIEFGQSHDQAEGALEALAQVMACKDQFKWRSQARKLIAVFTDADFHAAGDGRVAGIETPYDGGCYLDAKNMYSREAEMDYPSVGMVHWLANRDQFTVLFIVKGFQLAYDNLANKIRAHYHSFDDKSIIDSLETIYKSITYQLRLRVNLPSEYKNHFTIHFTPNCGETENSPHCIVTKGLEIPVNVTITLRKYFKKPRFPITIVPLGLSEQVAIDVDVIDSCACERREETAFDHASCARAGDLQCGICRCHANRYGPTCGCVVNEDNQLPADDSTCTRAGRVCSGRGVCVCGACQCNTNMYGGAYCQLSLDNCPRDNAHNLCSLRGECVDGNCSCRPGWSGPACGCLQSTAPCSPGPGLPVCSGYGECSCGKCECREPMALDVRHLDGVCRLQPCTDCHGEQCRQLIPCLECGEGGAGDGAGDSGCPAECGAGLVVRAGALDAFPEELRATWNLCTNIRTRFGCYANFTYVYHDNYTITVYKLTDEDCVESQVVYGATSLAALLALGLATLVCWKLVTDARDRREYQQFLAAQDPAEEAAVNETYAPPTTTFTNPTFRMSFRR